MIYYKNMYKNILNKPLPFSNIYETPFSPLFQSFNINFNENLLNNTFGADFINQQLEEGEDNEDTIAKLLLYIQNHLKTICIIKDDGEILVEIPLTGQNLNKKITELVPESIISSIDEDSSQYYIEASFHGIFKI